MKCYIYEVFLGIIISHPPPPASIKNIFTSEPVDVESLQSPLDTIPVTDHIPTLPKKRKSPISVTQS